jgi:heat shock protein HslJ
MMLLTLSISAAGLVLAQPSDFPFDSELFLEAEPIPGSKRIPNIDIALDGRVVVEMWCNRVEGQLVVAGDTLTMTVGPPTERPCAPEQAQRDADLLSALNEVTNWRRQGDDLLLVGPTTLRFKTPTH